MPDTTIYTCDDCALAGRLIPDILKTRKTCHFCHKVKDCSVAKARTAKKTLPARERTGASNPEPHCPYCERNLNDVGIHYSVPASEYGSASVSGHEGNCSLDMEESDGCDTEGDATFSCANCDEDLEEGDIVWSTDTEDEDDEDDEEGPVNK